jgi:hypothetical protein
MAITQANIDYLEARHAEFWIPTSSSNATLKKATVGADPNPRNPSRWEIRLKDGYKFVGMPQMRHYWVSSWTAFYNMTEVYDVGEEQRAYINRTSTGVGQVDFNFEVALATALYEIKQSDLDLLASQNAVMKINNVAVALGSKISKTSTVTLTANAGFKLRQAYFQDEYGNISYFTIENGIGTYTPYDETPLIGFDVLTYSPVYKTTSADWSELYNAGVTATINGTAFNTNVDLFEGDILKLTPKANYVILEDDTFFKYGADSKQNFVFSGGVGQLTVGDYAYTGLQVRGKNTLVRINVNSNMLETLQTNNASMFINDLPVSIGSTAINGDKIRIKANTGYELADRPSFYVYSDDSGYQGTKYLNLIDENINAELVIDLGYENYLTNLEVITTQVDIVAGANNLYKITKADLKQINIDRFVNSGANPPTVIDYGTNILGVINLPFNINPDYIQDPELIKLGTHETTVTAPKVVTDKLYLNLGDINVPMPENSLGFTNATALIHLPYANSLTLDINAVLGQIINVEYVIDLYNGNSYVNIKSNKSDSIIASSSVDLGINIPYSSMLGDNNTVYNSNMSLGGDNHVKTPYIEIIQNIPILGNGFFTAPITAESTLNSEKGFIQVENINLNVKATSNEKDMILTALRSGVIIND